MRSLLILVVTLVCLLEAESSALHAQNKTLKLCSETIMNTRQAVNENKLPTQDALVPYFGSNYQKVRQSQYQWVECVKGQRAPMSSFKTLNGELYEKASLSGKIIVVNFWFMSCAPCRAEFPALNKLVEEYKERNVLFLGFTPDRVSTLKPAFFVSNRFDFKIIAEAQDIANLFYITGYPTTYIIDQHGVIRQAWLGFRGSEIDKLAPYYKAKEAIDNLLRTDDK